MTEKKVLVEIGKVTGSVGLKGEIKIYHFADDPEVLKVLNTIIIDGKDYSVENIRYRKKTPVMRLSGVNTRELSEELINSQVYVYGDQFPDLPENNYYVKDLIGLNLEDHFGNSVGIIQDVISGSAQDVYQVLCADGKKMLVPAITDFIKKIDLDQKKILVELPEGIEATKY